MSDQTLDDFRVGDVITKSFKTLFRNIIPFTIMGAIILAPMFLFVFIVLGSADLNQITNYIGGWQGLVAFFMLYFGFTYIIYGAITFGTIRDLQGKKAGIGEILARGFSTLLPVIGVAIITTIIVILGYVLLIIPGVIASVILAVVIPVTVIERPGVFASLSRSAELTKGFRWKVFGVILVAGVINAILNFGLEFLVNPNGIIGLAFYLVVTALTAAFGAVFIAVTYQELRRVKEGVDIDTIASVFA